MTDLLRVLDDLRDRGFVPQDDFGTFDLAAGSAYADRLVRVTLDDNEVNVRLMTGNETEIWLARLTGVPYAVFEAVLEVAVTEGDHARATPLRRPDLIERDAMAAALQALGTERLRSMLGRTEENPRNKERWDSLPVAGVRMIVDPDLLRAELVRR